MVGLRRYINPTHQPLFFFFFNLTQPPFFFFFFLTPPTHRFFFFFFFFFNPTHPPLFFFSSFTSLERNSIRALGKRLKHLKICFQSCVLLNIKGILLKKKKMINLTKQKVGMYSSFASVKLFFFSSYIYDGKVHNKCPNREKTHGKNPIIESRFTDRRDITNNNKIGVKHRKGTFGHLRKLSFQISLRSPFDVFFSV